MPGKITETDTAPGSLPRLWPRCWHVDPESHVVLPATPHLSLWPCSCHRANPSLRLHGARLPSGCSLHSHSGFSIAGSNGGLTPWVATELEVADLPLWMRVEHRAPSAPVGRSREALCKPTVPCHESYSRNAGAQRAAQPGLRGRQTADTSGCPSWCPGTCPTPRPHTQTLKPAHQCRGDKDGQHSLSSESAGHMDGSAACQLVLSHGKQAPATSPYAHARLSGAFPETQRQTLSILHEALYPDVCATVCLH